MSVPVFSPSIQLIRVKREIWQSQVSSEGFTLVSLIQDALTAGRKMAKGVSIQHQRASLCLVYDRLLTWVKQAPSASFSVWTVPSEIQPAWDALLEMLARQRANKAAHALNRQWVLPFLPALFAPTGAESIEAGAYGRFDVAAHIEDLQGWKEQAVSVPNLDSAIQQRTALFNLAQTNNEGIVELVGFPPPVNRHEGYPV
jgi:hypothetical protein